MLPTRRRTVKAENQQTYICLFFSLSLKWSHLFTLHFLLFLLGELRSYCNASKTHMKVLLLWTVGLIQLSAGNKPTSCLRAPSADVSAAQKTVSQQQQTAFRLQLKSETLPAQPSGFHSLWFSSHSGLMSHGLSALPVNIWLQNELTTMRRALTVSAAAQLRLNDSTECESSVFIFSWF